MPRGGRPGYPEDHLGAVSGKQHGVGFAHPAAGAGDDYDFPIDLRHLISCHDAKNRCVLTEERAAFVALPLSGAASTSACHKPCVVPDGDIGGCAAMAHAAAGPISAGLSDAPV